jgi:C-5 cytosine-specific DNA methylase
MLKTYSIELILYNTNTNVLSSATESLTSCNSTYSCICYERSLRIACKAHSPRWRLEVVTEPGSCWFYWYSPFRDNVSSSFSDVMYYDNHCRMIFSEYSGTGKTKSMCKCQTLAGVMCERRQKGAEKTIPWCLAHTASRNAHWAGALGRLHPLQPFQTIVTTLNPLKSNGIIIHPTQDRFITVREAARAQSFPDSFHFSANRKSALKQVIQVVQNNKHYHII